MSLLVRGLIGRGLIGRRLLASPPVLQGNGMDTDPRILFGLRLIELRKKRGWSQERLALESSIARSYLGGVERGKRNIAILNIFRLAAALEVAPSMLLELPGATRDPD